MNHLIVFAHPNPASFGSAICKEVKKASESKGNKVTVRNLYELNFNPVLTGSELAGNAVADVKTEQQYITDADHITLIYPIWWGAMPAILKGYIDRVFSYGFAYLPEPDGVKGLLKGKKASVVYTTGTTGEILDGAGITDAIQLMDEGVIFQFCGLEPAGTFHYSNIAGVSYETRVEWLKDISNQIAKIV